MQWWELFQFVCSKQSSPHYLLGFGIEICHIELRVMIICMRKKLVSVSLYEIELIFQILELMLSEHLELNFIGKSPQPSHPPHAYSSTTAVALRLFLIGKRRRICSNNAMIISLEIRAGDPAFRIVHDTLLSTSFQSVREKKEVWRALYYLPHRCNEWWLRSPVEDIYAMPFPSISVGLLEIPPTCFESCCRGSSWRWRERLLQRDAINDTTC